MKQISDHIGHFQICHIEIDSWTLPIPELELQGNESYIVSGQLRPSGQWEFVNSWIHEELSITPGASAYKTLSLVFHLRRKPLYVCVNLFTPVLGIMLLQLAVFRMPPDAGEKISLGLTLLLSQTVFQLVVQQNVPETSDKTLPIFSKQQHF